MNCVDRLEMIQRMMKYNPDISSERLSYFCAIFERILDTGFEFASDDSEDKWEEYEAGKASWSPELQYDLENVGINIDDELADIMIKELCYTIPDSFKLAYLKFTRVCTESFNPRIQVYYVGYDE